MTNRTSKFNSAGTLLYPHIKLTRERFPRVLGTRLPDDAEAEFFGAFLNRTNARILIDFLVRTFRLRSCQIEIDGSFNYPCTEYYRRRCLAPCVADLCSEEKYLEHVGLLVLFLGNERELFLSVIQTKIAAAAEALDFETAARLRDILHAVEEYWKDTRHAAWVDGLSDSYHAQAGENGVDVFLTSQKGRRVLGERVFAFPNASESHIPEILRSVITQFYRFHLPKEIRVPLGPAERADIQKQLAADHGRDVPVVGRNEKNRKISNELALYRSSAELAVKRATPQLSQKEIAAMLKRTFKLGRLPARIVAIDAAHISGTDQVAAAIVWENGGYVADAARYLISQNSSEPGILAELAAEYASASEGNLLILLDGGTAQLNAALRALPAGSRAELIAAVKPTGRHTQISHFIARDGQRVEYSADDPSMLLLHRLRDDAHIFANSVHRDIRDFAGFYAAVNALPSLTETERNILVVHFGSLRSVTEQTESSLAAVIGPKRAAVAVADLAAGGTRKSIHPLVVPLRLQDENGSAEDLRPIETARRSR